MIYDFFVNLVLAPIILLIGILGNLLALLVLSNKKIKKIGPVLFYRLLFITDSAFLITIVILYLQTGFSFDNLNLNKK